MKNIYLGIYRRNRIRTCDCCGKKLEPKVPGIEVPMPLGLKTKTLCYPCATEILINNFIKDD